MRKTLFLLLGLVACSSGSPSTFGVGGGSSQAVATVVEVEPAQVGAVSDQLITNATVESERMARVLPQTTGLVREVLAAEGDPVQRGQVLAVIDNISLDETANRAVAELRRLEAELEVSRRLVEQRAMAQRELDELEGRVLGQRSTLREAQVTRKQTRLLAPFDGVVGAREIRVGEVATSSTEAFTIVDLDALLVVASLPERDVSRVRVGQSARAVSAYDPDSFAHATIERIAPIIDANTGTFRVQLRLDEGQRALRPGQFVSVAIEVDRHEDVVVIPKRALVYEDGMPVVYRRVRREIEEDAQDASSSEGPLSGASQGAGGRGMGSWFRRGRGGWSGGSGPSARPKEPPSPYVAERVRIELGLVDDDHAEIVRGIQPGDEVIVLGQSALRDGARVRVLSDSDATDEGSQASTDFGEPG
ncbi:MAG: efflux RND transporter periplasmic adaptor subunit [Deltaproteobacteria bacterium]|nr:MAG: efflux RND transporter periplasmic adaptor subunit [Deltaproteobacteria bacterium]